MSKTEICKKTGTAFNVGDHVEFTTAGRAQHVVRGHIRSFYDTTGRGGSTYARIEDGAGVTRSNRISGLSKI